MKDKEFLEWLWYRLWKVHGEHPFVDYMGKFWSIIEEYDPEKLTPNMRTNLKGLKDAEKEGNQHR